MKTKVQICAFLTAFMISYGCITIPMPENKVLSGERITTEQIVFIEQGITRKSEIIDHLGLPNVNLIDKNIYAYDWQTRQAIMIWAIGNGYQGSVGAIDIPKNYVFLVRFDAQDRVTNYEITARSLFESYGDHLDEYSAIMEGQKSLVLLRVTCKISSDSGVDPVQGCISGENASIALGDFETGGALERIVFLKSLSGETREQGWIYATLEPGIYYIAFQGQRRTDAFTFEAQLQNAQRFRFDIQPGTPLVYIGTMHLECRSDWFLFGLKYCCFIENHQIRNEEESARKIVSENLKTLGKPKTSMMQPHTEKTLIFRTPNLKKQNPE